MCAVSTPLTSPLLYNEFEMLLWKILLSCNNSVPLLHNGNFLPTLNCNNKIHEVIKSQLFTGAMAACKSVWFDFQLSTDSINAICKACCHVYIIMYIMQCIYIRSKYNDKPVQAKNKAIQNACSTE